MSVDLEAGIGARLAASMDGLAAELRTRRERDERQRPPDFTYYPGRIVTGNAFPIFNAELGGPKTGYFWAVQFVNLAGLAAATDTAALYIGKSPLDVQLQNQFAPFPTPVGVGAGLGFASAINPGRTDLILRDGETLIASGTSASTFLVLRFSLIQAELRFFDKFLP